MIGHIKGMVDYMDGRMVVVDNNGVGYEIWVPDPVTEEVSRGSEVKLYTYLQVREDAMQLFGFLTRDDLNVFKSLITVNGVGPKAALSILSVMTTEGLKIACMSGDSRAISKAPGIGAKTASKIVLELKDKFSLETLGNDDGIEDTASGTGAKVPSAKNTDNKVLSDAILALTALGYSESEAFKAVHQADAGPDPDVDQVLKAALKFM
ncbi:MAG: Holliday junction branch migration protein RuvA [Lachnospiraceae bacterium]|jgi:Holliday junction DNA helicase RuvA|nr:Holliday junction branch migration protein RuvA [Lachnospiraceae bacterium]MEE3460515.1 Holliday junction branch migration protein RuvA [Lachnospiraceae bacterium]